MSSEPLQLNIAQHNLRFETGTIARHADGSVLAQMGETMVLATACAAAGASPEKDFLALRVDYQEKFSATGKTLGGFIKREGRPSEREILVSRLIDRSLRAMFPAGYFQEVHITCTVLSYDGCHSPDTLAICAAAAALLLSSIPLQRPVAGVRVGLLGNQLIINPTIEQQKHSSLDLLLAGSDAAILMTEGCCQFLSDDQLLAAIASGQQAIATICHALADWQQRIGKPKQLQQCWTCPEPLLKQITTDYREPLQNAFSIAEKHARAAALAAIKEQAIARWATEWSEMDVKLVFAKVQAQLLRQQLFATQQRFGGRRLDEIREISIKMPLLPRTHGSALFSRGQTQSLAVITLGGENMVQRFEDLNAGGSKRFYLQYFFPPYSVGEVGRMGPPGRREIGHGKLAENSLLPTLPSRAKFPYVIRLESNITASNGSSSMASVCGGCLAMMDAGVPIKRPIAGIAMGLLLAEERFLILSDITGSEDALGDMDLKVAGDADGITALQMDTKVHGITREILKVALAQARAGRAHILAEMAKACAQPRAKLSPYAPCIETLQVQPRKIGLIIGPGGKQIRAISEESKAEVDICDDGTITLCADSAAAISKAKQRIDQLVFELEVGKSYSGKITSIAPFGLFVDINGKSGLCHISELDHQPIDDLRARYREQQCIEVKVLDINGRGQIKLSRKALLRAP